jgi:hypothetical protein
VTHPIGGRTLTRLLVTLIALVVSATAALVPAQPAAARHGGVSRGEVVCIEKLTSEGLLLVRCFYLSDLTREIPLPPPPCPVCDVLGFKFPKTLPDDRRATVIDSLAAGYGLLGKAALTTNPEQVAVLRAEAMAQFASAADAATDPDIDPAMPVPVTGRFSADGFTEVDLPELAKAGGLTVEGLSLLVATDPDIDPMLPADLFDQAFDKFAGAPSR